MRKIKSIEDIKSGYVVRFRNGRLSICMRYEQEFFSKVLILNSGSVIRDTNNNYDGLKSKIHKNFDIVEVYGLSSNEYNCMEISTLDRPLLYKE